MFVNIYTSRIVLQALGVEDFGLYNVVGGFVLMLSVVNLTMATASQRYIAYELGCESPNIEKVFSTICTIHLILALIAFLLFETIGLYFVNYHMVIPEDRIIAANVVYQLSLGTFCLGLFSIPFSASIVAFEKMDIFAYISVFDALFKLIFIYLLFFVDSDKLISYSFIMSIISVFTNVFYIIFSKKKCRGCQFCLRCDKSRIKDIMSFSKWNLIGSTAGVLNNQGISVLINQFFSLSCNASRAIADQVSNAINVFVINFMMALNPQLTKSFASKDFSHLTELMYSGGKYSSFLLWFLTLPVLIDTEYILTLWLDVVPEYATMFVRFALIYNLAQSFSQVLYQAMLASGKIKKYQLVVGTLSIMAFPCCYLFFSLGLGPEWGYISAIIFSIICLIARVILLIQMIPSFSIACYLRKTIYPAVLVIVITGFIVFGVKYYTPTINLVGFIYTVLLSSCIIAFFIFGIGLNHKEKKFVVSTLKKHVDFRHLWTHI